MKRYFNLAGMLIILLFCCCEKQETTNEEIAIETPDWTESTHSAAVAPDYTTVFQQDKVQRLKFQRTSKGKCHVPDDYR